MKPRLSHQRSLFRMDLSRTTVAEHLAKARGVVLADPDRYRPLRRGQVFEAVEPDVLLPQIVEEALDQTVPLGEAGIDELLCQAAVAAGDPQVPTLREDPAIAPKDKRGRCRTQCGEPGAADLLQCPLFVADLCAKGELLHDDLTVVAVNDDGEIRPPIGAGLNVRAVHHQASAASHGAAHAALRPRLGCGFALVDESASAAQEPKDGHPVIRQSLPAQKRPQTRLAEGLVALVGVGWAHQASPLSRTDAAGDRHEWSLMPVTNLGRCPVSRAVPNGPGHPVLHECPPRPLQHSLTDIYWSGNGHLLGTLGSVPPNQGAVAHPPQRQPHTPTATPAPPPPGAHNVLRRPHILPSP